MATRYAVALIDIAAQAKALENVEKDLLELQAMLGSSPDLQNLLESPLVSREKQRKALSALADKAQFHTLTKNFIGVLARNGRLYAAQIIINTFRNELRRRRGQVEARVQTAHALTPAQTRALQEQLSKSTGSAVALNVEVNRDLLGGMIVTVGSRMIDDSVKRKLERLQRAMMNAGADKAA